MSELTADGGEELLEEGGGSELSEIDGSEPVIITSPSLSLAGKALLTFCPASVVSVAVLSGDEARPLLPFFLSALAIRAVQKVAFRDPLTC